MPELPGLYCARADFGRFAKAFIDGGYIAIGWISEKSLSEVKSRDELYPIYKAAHPEDTSNIVVGQQVGQIARFLLEIKAGDYVITPDLNTELLYYGIIEPDPSYFYAPGDNVCPFPHRRKIKWHKEPVKRSIFSVPFQNTIRSSLTVFAISQREHFFEITKSGDIISHTTREHHDPYKIVLEQLMELTAEEFELLITDLLTAVGFEKSEHTGKTGDGGVDATGELNVANLAKMKVFVQVKRYQPGTKINANTVRALRQSIPQNGQGAFITTADFQAAAGDIAIESGFPRIGLVNGMQLVDLLIEHWEDISQDFKEKLGLKPGLVKL